MPCGCLDDSRNSGYAHYVMCVHSSEIPRYAVERGLRGVFKAGVGGASGNRISGELNEPDARNYVMAAMGRIRRWCSMIVANIIFSGLENVLKYHCVKKNEKENSTFFSSNCKSKIANRKFPNRKSKIENRKSDQSPPLRIQIFSHPLIRTTLVGK